YDLTPGEYQFYFVTRAGYYLEKKVTIRANAIFCRLIGENPLHKMDSCSIPYSVLSPNRTSTALNTSYSFGNASLEITVRDGKTHELIPFAPVTLRKNKEKVMGVITDMNGIAHFNGLAEGSYEATAMYIGYGSAQEGSVFVRSDRLTKLNLNLLASTLELKSVEIVSYTEPLLMRSMSYSTMASKEMSQYLEVIPGVVSSNSYFFSDADTRSGGTITRDEYTALSSKADTLSKADLGAKGLRNSFSDYAYWVPNLITDEKGEAHFTATFPDNLTTWNSHFAGMDAHKRSGMGIAHTKAMKKVTASLNLPRFLVAGDGYGVQEKILNHTSAVYKLKSSLLLGTTLLEEKDTLLNQSILRYVSIPQASGDSCRLTYTIHLENGYTDGEYRAIPVYPKGVQEKTGIFMPLLHDTLASQSFDASKGPVYLHMTSLPTDLLLSDIEWMKQYPYECNEQKASKLIALLAEQKIKAARKEKFTGDKTIRSLVKKLQDAQNTDGSWGWWGGCNANLWMTTYVTEALYKAFAAGYDVHVTGKAFEYMRWTLAVPGTAHTLYALKVLSECKQGAEYEQILKRIKKDSLGMTDRLLYEKIKQNTGLPIDLSYILSRKKETLMGACYWAGYENGFYDNSTACSIAAYDLLRTDSANRYLCDKLFLYFLEQRSHSGAWRNTVETASLIDLLYPDFLNKQKQEEAKPILLVSSGVRSKSYTHFPFTDTIQVSNLSIQKSGGGNVYFTAYQKSFNPEPEKLSTLFEISTSFTSNKQATETLVPGQPLEMLVDVEVKQKSEFLMLNVPIPAGCTYGPRNNFHEPQESRREQYKDHVAIFCELLTPGHYQFHINLEARYAGTYTLNPAQMESMYFPTLKGRNTCRKVVVK
ncbi:MAG TPA: alpha-2-macroglobulin family protein, partial [Bacteroidia bacterium]|nr:alpha-2-macroglobulin family protein [Bacteroidia bacterium]